MMAPSSDALRLEVRANTKTIRHLLAQRIKSQVRIVPELAFFLDDSAEYAARIDKLFDGIEIPPAREDDEDDETYPNK
jgi:ribosome-binding factor A